jgi:hypothetical protein
MSRVYNTGMSSQSHDTRSVSNASLAPSSFFARHGAQQLPSLSGAAVSQEHAILEPFRYTCSVSGKGMRSKIIEVFNNWLKVSDACRMQTAAIVEKLHNASLIIGPFQGGVHAACDAHRVSIIPHPHPSQMISRTARCSVVDGLSLTRCTRPALPTMKYCNTLARFGEAASINCANFIYFEAFHDAVCLGKPQVVPALLDELMKLHLGQVRARRPARVHFSDRLLCNATRLLFNTPPAS